MTPIATICHGADDPHDADHRRLTLLIDTTTGYVYVRETDDDDEPECVGVNGISQVSTSYEGASWDLEWLIDPREYDNRGRLLDLPYVLTEYGDECSFASLAEAQHAVRACYPDDEPTTLTVRGQVQDADGRWLDSIVDETGARVGHVEKTSR